MKRSKEAMANTKALGKDHWYFFACLIACLPLNQYALSASLHCLTRLFVPCPHFNNRVPFKRGQDLAIKYKVEPYLRTLFEYNVPEGETDTTPTKEMIH